MARATDRMALIMDFRAQGAKSAGKLATNLSRVDKQFRGLQQRFGKTPFRPAKLGAQEFQGAMNNLKASLRNGQGTMRRSQTALNNFSLVLQDAPYGIRGVANNIPMLLTSLQRLKQDAGSTSGAFSQLLGQMTAPGGMLIIGAALVPLIGEMSRKIDFFGGRSEEASKSAEKLVERWDKLLDMLTESADMETDDPFGFQKQQVQLEKTTQLINELQGKINDKYLSWSDALEHVNNLANSIAVKVATWFGESEKVQAIKSQISKLQEKQVKLQSDILGAQILSEQSTAQNLKNISEIIKRTESAEKAENQLNKARQKGLEELRKKAQSDIVEPDIGLPDFKTAAEAHKEFQKNASKDAEQLQKRSLQERIKMARLQGDKLKTLRLERQKAIQETRKFDLTNWEKAQQMRLQIKKRYDRKITEAEKEMAKKKKQAQQWFLQQRMSLAEMQGNKMEALRLKEKIAVKKLNKDNFQTEKQYEKAVSMIKNKFSKRRTQMEKQEGASRKQIISSVSNFAQASVQAAFGETKNARYAMAGINTLTGITQALATGEPPWSFIQAAAVAAKGYAAQRKIANMDMDSGSAQTGGVGTGGGGQRFGFRGFSSQGATGNQGQDLNIPNELMLKDRSGKLLSKLEYARDQQGNDPYLVDKED